TAGDNEPPVRSRKRGANGAGAPIPDLPAPASYRGGSTLGSHSLRATAAVRNAPQQTFVKGIQTFRRVCPFDQLITYIRLGLASPGYPREAQRSRRYLVGRDRLQRLHAVFAVASRAASAAPSALTSRRRLSISTLSYARAARAPKIRSDSHSSAVMSLPVRCGPKRATALPSAAPPQTGAARHGACSSPGRPGR